MTDETVADYDIRSPASRTLLTVVATLVAVGVVGGLVLGTSILMRDTRISTSVIDLDGSGQVIVDATSANISIVEGADDVVKLTARVTSGLRATDYRLGRRGDVIRVASGCQTWLSPGCGVKVSLEVPRGLPVVVNTVSGNVKVTGLSVDELAVTTRSGNVEATFADQPFAFKATTDDGDISGTIPTGRRTYVVL